MNPGSFNRGDETVCFQIRCDMQPGLLRTDYTKRETSENEVMVLGLGATVQHNRNGVRAHSGGFLQIPAQSTLQCANIWPFRLKLPE